MANQIEVKKSIVKSIGTDKEPFESQHGILYKYDLVFENGDFGEYASKSNAQDKFVIGQEVEYEVHINPSYPKFPKIKPLYKQPQSFGGGFKENPERQQKIDRWAGLGRAIDYLHGTQPTEEQLYEQAKRFISWVNKKPKQSLKENFDEMEKAKNDLPF
tara:strand:+ start:908 stop:1384 length:477 start_codon:yes stop_codon:yes gene_type:complete